MFSENEKYYSYASSLYRACRSWDSLLDSRTCAMSTSNKAILQNVKAPFKLSCHRSRYAEPMAISLTFLKNTSRLVYRPTTKFTAKNIAITAATRNTLNTTEPTPWYSPTKVATNPCTKLVINRNPNAGSNGGVIVLAATGGSHQVQIALADPCLIYFSLLAIAIWGGTFLQLAV